MLLFASSKEQLQKMLCEFKRSTEKVGLRIHPGKTKNLGNQSLNIRKEIDIDDIKVEILTREERTTYLSQMITFQKQETTEIRNRIRAAWATCHKYRQELTSRTYMRRYRLRLFDAVVSPTVYYASGTSTLTKEHERMTQSTQRKMFRLITQKKGDTKKSGDEKTRPTKTTTLKTWVALKMKMRTDKAQTHTQRPGQRHLFRERYR